VLASVLPVLDKAQFARLFGPALALTFHAPDYPDKQGWPIRRAVRPLPSAPTSTGMLALNAEQMRGIEAARYMRLHKRSVEYLARVGSGKLAGRDHETLARDTDIWLKSGLEFGISSERALWQWCYLQLFTNGQLTKAPGLDPYLKDRSTGEQPDAKIDMIMDAVIVRLREAAYWLPRRYWRSRRLSKALSFWVSRSASPIRSHPARKNANKASATSATPSPATPQPHLTLHSSAVKAASVRDERIDQIGQSVPKHAIHMFLFQ
jgi:hypothetical protein